MQTPQIKEVQLEEGENLYESDFYAWTQQQVNLLLHQQWSQLDVVNLVEEILSLGRRERQELRNRLGILLGHLLKWEYQPNKRSRSWLATIRIQRRDIVKLLHENPSLQSYVVEAITEAYQNGRDLAAGETNLPFTTFPEQCLYLWEDMINESFYPGLPASDDLKS
ncbi:DUF29 domain-containing protein [Sphaerospermopsis aphanizomenoides BCCUSP55]|uniref:DUF29 domain-containing protein n=1 Tax=Sphaerospermopsis aphanizomenoides TaxID=459663 RepID=UPI000AA825E8|nr:DUF29 domain-containing protein [Sphaerospermopsis aphanizomenoides]MBK1988456.1 DUF29 domain-containing protein [Sphaerospermopsis aphanizomenoides BCCUSP55]